MNNLTLLLSSPRYRKMYLKKTALDCDENNWERKQRREHEHMRRSGVAEAAGKRRPR